MASPLPPRNPQTNPAQLIQVLAEIQDRRRGLDLQQQQLDEQHQQFQQQYAAAAQRLGFEKDSEGFKRVENAIKSFSDMTGDQRSAMRDVLTSTGMPSQEVDALMQYATRSPSSPIAMQNQAVTAGQNPAANPVDREAYTRATTGMNMGQLSASQLGLQTNNALSQNFTDMTPQAVSQLAREYFARNIAGRPPEEVAMGDALMNGRNTRSQPIVPDAAAIRYGIRPSGAQQGQIEAQFADVRLRSIQDQNQFIAELAKLRTTQGSLTAEQRVAAYGRMSEIGARLQTSQSTGERDAQLATWNGIAGELGEPDLMIMNPADAPKASSLLNKIRQKMGGFTPQSPGSVVPQSNVPQLPLPQAPTPQLPMAGPASNMPQTPWMPRP